MAYAELVGSLQSLNVPASSAVAGAVAAAATVLEAPVSTSSLLVALDTTRVLAAIGRLGTVQVWQCVFMGHVRFGSSVVSDVL
jgi:hypothetical protein